MKIGNILIKKPLFLAPMAGVTDQPFRILCKEMGAGVVYTEFVSANGIIRENMKTLKLMEFSENERPIGIQLFGECPDIVGDSAKKVYELLQPDIIDINYGCPVPKVTKRGAGSAALKNLCLMEEIACSVLESVPQIPITVKMRSGWDDRSIVSTEAGIKLEKLGISAITLHARTTKQLYSGSANWNLIKELKDSVSIPVIGNGDVRTISDYINIKKQTDCDGVMIGRAAMGKPWIFSLLDAEESNNNEVYNDISTIINIAKRHFRMLMDYYSNKFIIVNMSKKHFNYYFRGFSGASHWRRTFMKIESIDQIFPILSEMENELA